MDPTGIPEVVLLSVFALHEGRMKARATIPAVRLKSADNFFMGLFYGDEYKQTTKQKRKFSTRSASPLKRITSEGS
jgi:hypothetical protein